MLSVGDIFKKEREKQGISLKNIEKKIKVREKFLKAIENNNWNYFTSKVYISGVITNYAEYLGLDTEKLLAYFRRDYERREKIRFSKKISSKYLTPETKKYATIAVVIVFLIFLSYFGYQLKCFFSPPNINIISPLKNTFQNINKITIRGQTEKDALIFIKEERVYQNKEGIFVYDLPLQKGNNELTIEVEGPNGKKTILKKVYIMEEL